MKRLTDYELALLVQEVEEHEMLQAPARLKDEILEKSQSMHTKTVRQITKASVRMELILYGLKTTAAVAVAIFLFMFVSQPALQAGMQQNDRFTNWEKEISQEDDRYPNYKKALPPWLDKENQDWEDESQNYNWRISDVLQDVNSKMKGFLGGFYGK